MSVLLSHFITKRSLLLVIAHSLGMIGASYWNGKTKLLLKELKKKTSEESLNCANCTGRVKHSVSMATIPPGGKTALCFPLIFTCFSVCRIRGSDYWSTGWIPTRLEQAQGILCPRSDHHLLFGVISNPDFCKYFHPILSFPHWQFPADDILERSVFLF